MKWIRERVLNGEWMGGTFLNLGSSVTAEIAGQAGFDWLLVDLEHGMGDRHEMLLQLQAMAGSPSAPLVRIAWNDPVRVKRVLDLGVSGVMFPYVCSADEAQHAVAAMRYPPAGVRGVARTNRACDFGPGFDEYFRAANSQLLTIVQVETRDAVGHSDEIAAVEGVDVLFIGPLDLSVSLGAVGQWDHPAVRAAFEKVLNACKKSEKIAGILASTEEQVARVRELGFTFVGLSSDGGALALAMRQIASSLRKLKTAS